MRMRGVLAIPLSLLLSLSPVPIFIFLSLMLGLGFPFSVLGFLFCRRHSIQVKLILSIQILFIRRISRWVPGRGDIFLSLFLIDIGNSDIWYLVRVSLLSRWCSICGSAWNVARISFSSSSFLEDGVLSIFVPNWILCPFWVNLDLSSIFLDN